MFSGIVETLGTIRYLNKTNDTVVFHIEPHHPFNDVRIGDSIAVNGVCLTVTELMGNLFSVTAVPETLRLTNLKELEQESTLNLERALLVGGRNGGHNVQGHVDAIGSIVAIEQDGRDAWLVTIKVPTELSKYIVKKGYITIDGMSITVVDASPGQFSVTFIPHTREVTIVSQYQLGRIVNLEVDILGKYIEQIIAAQGIIGK